MVRSEQNKYDNTSVIKICTILVLGSPIYVWRIPQWFPGSSFFCIYTQPQQNGIANKRDIIRWMDLHVKLRDNTSPMDLPYIEKLYISGKIYSTISICHYIKHPYLIIIYLYRYTYMIHDKNGGWWVTHAVLYGILNNHRFQTGVPQLMKWVIESIYDKLRTWYQLHTFQKHLWALKSKSSKNLHVV